MKLLQKYKLLAGVFPLAGFFCLSNAVAQEEDEVFELSPFSVEASDSTGYQATSTLAGTRIKTNLN